MRSLFWKMFIGTWLTVTVMVAATVYITHFANFDDPSEDARWEGPLLFDAMMRNLRRTHRHGPEHFRNWLRRLPEGTADRIYVVDMGGREILDRPIPESLDTLFRTLNPRNRESRILVDRKPVFGFFVPMRNGNHLRIAISAQESKEELLLKFLLKRFGPILLLSLLVSGIACFLLARYLSRPIQKISAATQKVAEGELHHRVAPTLGNREDELARLAREFDSMTEKLDASMSEQRRLVKDVSHELRSPLARLQVALALARQKQQGNGDINPELDKIAKAADYLEDIIGDILSMPVVGADERPLDDVVEMNGLIHALIADLGDEAAGKSIAIDFNSSVDEALVATRGSSLTAALENILRNAIRYSPEQSDIRIGISAGASVRAGKDKQHRLKLTIEDAGQGVPEEKLDAIFRPFYRTDEARARESGGYGLGLAIAQRTIRSHEGEILARNTTDRGLRVEIFLPILETDF